MELVPFEEYARSLHRKRMSAGVVFHDGERRVLLVETSYKTEWDVPGGTVDADEPPWRTARREVLEELGIDRPLGRLLVIDHVPAEGPMPEGLDLLWDGGVLGDDHLRGITLADPEILSVRFCTPDEVGRLATAGLAGRVAAALIAVDEERLVLCEAGRAVR